MRKKFIKILNQINFPINLRVNNIECLDWLLNLL